LGGRLRPLSEPRRRRPNSFASHRRTWPDNPREVLSDTRSQAYPAEISPSSFFVRQVNIARTLGAVSARVALKSREHQLPRCKLALITRKSNLFHGVLAQLVERLNGIEEVRGSNPLGSTKNNSLGPNECRSVSAGAWMLFRFVGFRSGLLLTTISIRSNSSNDRVSCRSGGW
jgi:hypothetical protein